MKKSLRKIVKNNIIIYALWFITIRRNKGTKVDFFKKDTDLYIDGYPRSGNTYIIHMVKGLFPKWKVVHHLHAIAPIKIAFLLKLPVFILVRDPMEAISSRYLKHFSMRDKKVDKNIDVKLLDVFMSGYLNYYGFVKDNIDVINIITFHELINSTFDVLKIINTDLKLDSEFDAGDVLELKATYQGGSTKKMGSSKPNPEKEYYKSLVKKHIAHSPHYKDVLSLYNSISK